MALGNLSFTSTGSDVLRRVYSLLGVTDSSAFGTTDTNGDAIVAEFLTQAERKAYQKHPGLGRGTATVTFSANARSASVPAVMFELSGLNYLNASSSRNGEEIPIISFAEANKMEPFGDWTETVASFAYLDADKTSLYLSHKASEETTYTMRLRTAPTEYTSALTETSAIPDEFIDVLTYRVAADLALQMRDMTGVQAFSAKTREADMDLTQYLASQPWTLDAPTHRHLANPNLSQKDQMDGGAFVPFFAGF